MRKLGVARGGEDHLAPAPGEALAAAAGAGLDDHRVALRRARHGEGPARGEEFALVVEPLHLASDRRSGRVFLSMMMAPSSQRVPVPEHHLHELVGLVVAQVVVAGAPRRPMLRASPSLTEVTTFQAARPLRHQVERGEPAGDVEGLEVGGRAGRGEAQLLRHRAHGHEHDQRVHLGGADAVLDGVRVVVAVAVGHGEAVVEEGHVELAGLQDAGDLLVVVGGMGIVARLRMPPGARQVRAVLRLQEPDHHHLPRHAIFSILGVLGQDRTAPAIGGASTGAGRQLNLGEGRARQPSRIRSASARSLSHVASSTSMPDLRRSCSRRCSTSPG